MIRTIFSFLTPQIQVNYTDDFGGCAAVVAVPFNCYLDGNLPDQSNSAIATVVRKYCKQYRIYAYLQWEQAKICQSAGVCVIQSNLSTGAGEHVQTQSQLQWAASEIQKLGRGNKVILVGHPHHVRRVAILARHYGLDPRIPSVCGRIPYDPSNRPGVQWWTKNRWRYIPWEYMSRGVLILYALLGRL